MVMGLGGAQQVIAVRKMAEIILQNRECKH